MDEKNYSFKELSRYNKTYNQMLKFLDSTIDKERKPDILQKFEDKAMEDDDRYKGLKWMLNINGLGTLSTAVIAMCGNYGALGATVVTGAYTFVYYLWCKRVMKESKANKEECLRFMKAVSEFQNDIKYPFGIGEYDDLADMERYLKESSSKDSILNQNKNVSIGEENLKNNDFIQ